MYDIPEGYKFVRFGKRNKNDLFIGSSGVVKISDINGDFDYWIIVEKIPEQELPSHNTKRRKHADLIHAWADGAEIQYQKANGSWDCVFENRPVWSDCDIYRIKPKTKIVRFRNFLHSIGGIMATDEDVSKADFFKEWIGDWQEVEIEENE